MTYKKLNPNQTLSLSLSLSLSLFHLNTCSLNKNFDDLGYLIKTTNQTFDVIAIIKSNMDITTNINLPNYSSEYTPTESCWMLRRKLNNNNNNQNKKWSDNSEVV